MKERRIAFPVLILLLLTAVLSCERQSPAFPAGEGALRLSADTLRFDTLFSGLPSTTAWLRVYNASSRPLLLDSVCLRSGGQSGFRISLDAMSGSVFRQVEIPPRDSLFLFVALTAPEQGSGVPVKISDEIDFFQAGNKEQINLEAWAWDALRWKGRRFDSDTLLSPTLPIVVYDSLVVGEGACLRLAPGTRLFFHDEAALLVDGQIRAEGTADDPVVFRGDRLDMAFEDFPYEYYPGQWYGICLGPQSFGNVMKHVSVRGACYGVVCESDANADTLKLEISHSEIFNMLYSNLYSIKSKIRADNCVFANSGSYTVALIGGDSRFVHCTLANYQRLTTREDEPSLVIVNFTVDEQEQVEPCPLVMAGFENTIVYGSHDTEIGFGLLEDYAHGLAFSHCLLRCPDPLPGEVSDSIRYNEDPCFVNTGTDWHYDFRLREGSPAIGRADAAVSAAYPLDLDGHSRLQDGAPDLGAYEFIVF
ncbi:MAG: hypothetical protein IJ154_01750 [Bacteroidales bacterium]|nr:hypothetical protein [Bacteroidales bacterium]